MNRTIRLCALAVREGIAAPVPRAAVFAPPTSYQKRNRKGTTSRDFSADPKRPETSRGPSREATEITAFKIPFKIPFKVRFPFDPDESMNR